MRPLGAGSETGGMEYVKLGNTGLDVSRICLGCMSYGDPDRGNHPWSLDEDAEPAVHQGRRSRPGINFFDTANVYSDGTSEEIVGRALARVRQPRRGRHRHQGPRPDARRAQRRGPVAQGDHDRDRRTACAGSAPTTSTSTRSTAGTRTTPIEETLEALHDVVKAGKARYIGASSMYAWQFAKALYVADRTAGRASSSMQNHYNLLYREEEREMLPLCADQGVGVIPWSPLARGRLTRDWDETTERSRDRRRSARPSTHESTDRVIVERVAEVAADRGVSAGPGRAGLGAAANPAVTAPIVGATKPQPPRRRRRRRRPGAHRRRDRRARGALRPARRRRVLSQKRTGRSSSRCHRPSTRPYPSTGGSPRDGLS